MVREFDRVFEMPQIATSTLRHSVFFSTLLCTSSYVLEGSRKTKRTREVEKSGKTYEKVKENVPPEGREILGACIRTF